MEKIVETLSTDLTNVRNILTDIGLTTSVITYNLFDDFLTSPHCQGVIETHDVITKIAIGFVEKFNHIIEWSEACQNWKETGIPENSQDWEDAVINYAKEILSKGIEDKTTF